LTKEEFRDFELNFYRRLSDLARAKKKINFERSLQDIRERTENMTVMLGQSCELGYRMEWSKWTGKIPYIKFNPDWSVKVVPPYNGAMVRFLVKRGEVGPVSVFLDCHNALALFVDHIGSQAPYWEVYPFEDDGLLRVAMDNVEELVEAISKSLDYLATVGS